MTRNFQNVVMFVTFLKQVDQDVALFSVLGADTSGCIFRKRRWHTAEQHKSWPNLDSGMVFTSKDCGPDEDRVGDPGGVLDPAETEVDD